MAATTEQAKREAGGFSADALSLVADCPDGLRPQGGEQAADQPSTSGGAESNFLSSYPLSAGLGKTIIGKWSLTVRVPSQPSREFKDQPFAKPQFKKLTWVGFTSNATKTTVFHLDNFNLTTSQE